MNENVTTSENPVQPKILAEETEQSEFVALIENGLGEKIKTIHPCQGYNSYAFEVNDHLIVRFPRYDFSLDKLKKEQKILQFLKDKVDCVIPDTTLVEKDFAFAVHHKIPGAPLSWDDYQNLETKQQDDFTEKLSQFMAQMHDINIADTKDLNLDVFKSYEWFPQKEILMDQLAHSKELETSEIKFLENFYDTWFARPLEKTEYVFGHNDLMPKNIAFDHDKKTLAGIYDFGDSNLVHYPYEFSQIALDWPVELVSNLAARYTRQTGRPVDAKQAMDRVLYIHSCFYAKHINEEGTTPDGFLQKLRHRIKYQQTL
jgi:aminoglycoside 2''-phosphotransferase